MITARGLYEDFKAIDANVELNDIQKIGAKIEKLAKVVLNCRTNSVAVMDKLGIPRETIKKEEVK
ncbi:MAG: hypothetical protein V1901_04205 [Patescibacteria group bacterium]